MKELLSYVAGALVDQPEAIQIVETVEDDMVVLALRVAKEDLGKVIGKQGRTARAIRSLLTAAAAKENKRARLEILE
jgi:predicted RNA-binding protein YlqC (UPF0109 family)